MKGLPPLGLEISVVLCTHNPRRDYLARVLAALQRQTFDKDRWELVVVDNASSEALGAWLDVSWHPRARVINEERLGQVFARVQGIKSSTAPILLFVDDDNELASDYLANAKVYMEEWFQLGAFCGDLKGEFDEPPKISSRWFSLLAVDTLTVDYWSNNPDDYRAYPCGAGLVVRRVVAEEWKRLFEMDARRSVLSRQGQQLAGGDDTDLALTALGLGYGMGRFKSLVLTHLIPSRRVQANYLVAISAGHAWSDMWVRSFWKRKLPNPGFLRRTFFLLRAACDSWLAFRIEFARLKAMNSARRQIDEQNGAE